MEDEDDATYNSESDETVTLSEIVTGRDVTLREEELWALCRECCLTLEFVHSTQELFQSLVITPETVAFDREGNVCFLDLDAEPESLYIPPEYEEDGCSYKSELHSPSSHLYSLGMTLLFAVEYSSNPGNENSNSTLSQDIRDLLTHLTQDSPDNRPDLELVLEYCDRALQDISSQDVCQRFACVPAEEEIAKEEGTSLLSMTEELAAYLNNQNGLVTPAQHTSINIPGSDSSKTVSTNNSSKSKQQQVSSTETQTAQPVQASGNVKTDSQPREKKGTEPANPMEFSQTSTGEDSTLTTPRRSRRRQGLLLADILTALDRDLLEAELWALCRECIVSLQRKKKHLPAYISPDTVMIREVGSVSFKAIPEDKPLEVVYMAPELQQKGILNEKTCMYGLGVTLRCAAGHKYWDEHIDDKVGLAFQELLTTLLEENPDHRPSLEVALMACDEFEKQGSTDSRLLCQEIFMDACALNSNREPKKSEVVSAELEDSAIMATDLQTSWTELEDAEREGVFLEDQMDQEEDTAQVEPKTFQPVPPKEGSTASGSAFKPVPFIPKPGKMTETGDQSSFPSAFSSPANYFKPIVLESAPTPKDTDTHSATRSATDDDDKEKNVMQKLREIKKNLLKHRPPGSLSKDVEVDNSKPPIVMEKTRTPRTSASGRSSRKSSNAGETAGALENLLQQLQSSGQMPDTQNLALAIAQHLQAKMGIAGEATGDVSKTPPFSSQNTPSSSHNTPSSSHNASDIENVASGISQPPVVSSQASGVESQAQVYQSSPASTVKTVSSDVQPVSAMTHAQDPSPLQVPQFVGQVGGMAGVSQAGYVPQPMPMPVMPFAGGVMAGSVQYQLQQDPRTGLLQLVPIPVVSLAPGTTHSPHASDHVHNPWQQPLAVSHGPGLTPDYGADSEDVFQRQPAKPSVNSRNARGLIQKTASQRAKNAASASTSPTGYLSDGATGHSNSQVDSAQFSANGLPNKDASYHKRSKSSGAVDFSESISIRKRNIMDGDEDYSLTSAEDKTSPQNRNVCVNNPAQVLRSSSQSSSPSPSKDSGICLTQGVNAPLVSSASLMERLLSSDSLRHQQSVTQVLHILTQAFGDQGPDNFHSEEMLAEYIVSLAHLKWETFMRAVTEKYSHLFWSHTLLINLFHAVNKQASSPSTSKLSDQTQLPRGEHSGLGKQEGSPQSYDAQNVNHRRKQAVPTFADSEGIEGATEHPHTRHRSGETGSKQKSKADRGSVAGKGLETDEPQSLVRVLANGRYISGPSETSDSTDNEQEEKRRRFKKRYELDRNKSSSLQSLSGTAKLSLPPDQGVVGTGNILHRHSSVPADQDVKNSQLREAADTRIHGHSQSEVRITKPYRDGDTNGAELHFRSDSGSAQMSPGSYHSLPRPAKSSHSQHSRSPEGMSPSRSVVSGFSNSYRVPHTHSPSSAGAEVPPHPPRHLLSQLGATSHSQSSQQHLHSTDSHSPHRSEARDPHRQYRDSPNQQGPSRTNVNNSSVSNSYTPPFNHGSRESGTGKRPPDHNRPSAHGDLGTEGFVFGQLREPVGKPPSIATPQMTRNLRNTHSPYNQGDSPDNRNSALPSVPRSQSEVNNNTSKQNGGDRESRGTKVSSPRNRDRSPVRRTQHKAKPKLAWDQEIAEYRKKGQVVYHSAMIQLSMSPEVNRFVHTVDEKSRSSIQNQLASLEQEMTMLRRQRRKSQAFYKRLTDPAIKQATKGENKGVVSQVLKDMSEMTSKLRYLDLCRTHLQMLLAELCGLETCFLHSLVTSDGRRGEEDPQPLVLSRCAENQWLQFQTVRETSTRCEIHVLQAGHPGGLLAYLFTLSALSDGYIHQFLFCFRYFLRAEEVFAFITQKYIAAHKGNQNDPDIVRTQQRALDLLQFWVEGYYSVDFERNDPLLDHLETFIMQRVEEATEGSQNLMNLLYACHLGENSELIRQADDTEDQDEVYYLHLASPKRWESFRSLLGRKKTESVSKGSKNEEKGVVVEKRPHSRADDGSTLSLSRRTDVTQLMDYTPHRLAEQLTLMEQELFQRTHPVHFLDSKSQGIGVDLSIPSLRTPSMTRKAKPGSQSLFVGATLFEPRISELISRSQEITHWVSAEILCCGSQKSQVGALTKFLQTAQLCVEIRNYATALAIIAGLDNLLVRQLPAWKHLPAKTANLMEDLEAIQVKLKGEPMALMQCKDSHIYPTIPCTLYFLLHLQQLEIGGFTLANGMFKWQKMRSISQMIDQIRIFREHEYGFEPDYELQSLICRRLHELSDRDLHTVAAAHDNNFRRIVSHAAGIQGTWRKVKVKLQSRSK